MRCKTSPAAAVAVMASEVVVSSEPTADTDQRAWSAAWNWYIHGNVVSDHASRLITNFLTSTPARTFGHDDSDEEEDENFWEP